MFWVKNYSELHRERQVLFKTLWAENQDEPLELLIDTLTKQEVASYELEVLEGKVYRGWVDGKFIHFIDDYGDEQRLSKNFVNYIA